MKRILGVVLVVAVVAVVAVLAPRMGEAQGITQNNVASRYISTGTTSFVSGFKTPYALFGNYSTFPGLWLTATPNSTNFTILNVGGATTFNAAGAMSFRNANTETFNIDATGQPRIGVGNTAACSTCDATTRGRLCYVGGGAGVKDTVTVCAKDAGNAYAERTIY